MSSTGDLLKLLPVLPTGCCAEFVGEGAANVVFELNLPARVDDKRRALFGEKLLRVPKAGTQAYSYATLQTHWEQHVSPLFLPSDLVSQSLVRIDSHTQSTTSTTDESPFRCPSPPPSIISHLNAVLAMATPIRRPKFRATFVASDASLGMMVEDMRAQDPSHLAMEIKPKWLSPSPCAPADATRCRNCAKAGLLREMGKKKEQDSGVSDGGVPSFCPLVLLACRDDEDVLDGMASCLFLSAIDKTGRSKFSSFDNRHHHHHHLTLIPKLKEWLRTNTLLPRLRDLQAELDRAASAAAEGRGKIGNNNDDDDDNNDNKLGLLMTLRDCTLFLRIRDGTRVVEAKLGDLDMKNVGAKRKHWQDLERALNEGGFYHTPVEGAANANVNRPCWLVRM